MKHALPAALATSFFLAACANPVTAPSGGAVAGDGGSPAAVDAPPAFLVGAGDIAQCGSPGAEKTARLLDSLSGTVFAAGDNAYPVGSADDYRNCYEPTWGRHRTRTRPTPGNHDYGSLHATPYYNYFGGNAGPAGLGYYSYNLGAWHVVSLNSEVDIAAGGGQEQWLRADLAANRARCTAAYWHRPLFSSGPNGNNADLQGLWQVLYEHDVELVISGHDHLYERFAPQDAGGRPDPARGIRQFVVGTGGASIYSIGATRPNSETIGSDWGVLRLTLLSGSYQWDFIPVEGASYRDSGSTPCH